MGDTIETFTILSTAANATLTPIHHRMPVILSPGAFETWLSGGNVALDPTPETLLAVYPVSTRVNSPRHDDPEWHRADPVRIESAGSRKTARQQLTRRPAQTAPEGTLR